MSVKITYFVHGTCIENEKNLAIGWYPGELSEVGIEQAKKLGSLVADKKFDVVICSDLKRAMDSASLAFGNKYEIIPDARLREANYGDLTMHPAKEFKHLLVEYVDTPFPGGESYRQIEKRIAELLDFIKEKYDNCHVALLAHQAPQLALEVLLKGKTWQQAIVEDWRNTKAWQPGWQYEIR
jgi:broad specificity phosphatase PhoE